MSVYPMTDDATEAASAAALANSYDYCASVFSSISVVYVSAPKDAVDELSAYEHTDTLLSVIRHVLGLIEQDNCEDDLQAVRDQIITIEEQRAFLEMNEVSPDEWYEASAKIIDACSAAIGCNQAAQN
ncbi:MAG: hypothetical protein ACX94D_08245 [Henriciella sp.]